MPRRRFLLLVVVLLSPFALRVGVGSTPPDLDRWVARAMQTFDVPGIALAIVKDDAVVVAKGYGVRKLGEPRRRWTRARCSASRRTPRRSPRRRSACSSRRGKIEWDAPVIRYLPAFAMWDPFVTRELTVRDLLVHRSGLGLGAGDLLWWPPSTYDRKEIARRLRFIPPATSFRSAYAYDNVLYLVAGELIETISGQTWEDFVASRILAKVGMTGSNVRPFRRRPTGRQRGRDRTRASTARSAPIAPFAATTRTLPAASTRRPRTWRSGCACSCRAGKLADGSRLFSARDGATADDAS